MRPEILNPLFAEVEVLKGVGPQVAKLLKRLGLTRVVDVLYHLPTGAIERIKVAGGERRSARPQRDPRATPVSRPARTVRPRTVAHLRRRIRAGNTISLIYFNNPGWAKKQPPDGRDADRLGQARRAMATNGRSSIRKSAEPGKGPAPAMREPVYPLTEGLTNHRLGDLAGQALERRARACRMDRAEPAAREAWRGWRARLRASIASPAPAKRASGSPMTRYSPTSSR